MTKPAGIKLWGRNNSSNVMKVIWLLGEIGLPYERVDVGGPFGGTATPEYRAMNPLGVVPSLEEDGFTLFESNAILRYLCNAHAPASSLYPVAPRARAVVDAWLDFQQTALNRPQSVVFQGLVRTAPEKRDNAAIAAAATETSAIWAILDGRLASRPFLAGADFTLADIAFGVHVHRWFNMAVPNRPEAPHLHAWYQRLLARPTYKAHCAGPVT
ncbi:MAG: glutathione S-transferase family protein [Rhodospirillales bacterium]|nr:glutathione S-transferase family protein [Rhodospirillales bacterium]MDE2198128.1 glutathione S-transferase family protein [Rhodospirillales bacterium]MDE2575333.1 glutathione S-transferase family protein [Rhodospirillales bacterium]